MEIKQQMYGKETETYLVSALLVMVENMLLDL
jgi:hypothetical protein